MLVCSLITRERISRFSPNLACLFLETRKRAQEGQNSGETVLSAIPGEGVSFSSDTKRYRRMAPRPKLIVSKTRLQKQRSEPRKIFLGSIPKEDGFCSSDTKCDRRTAPRP
jgi:hypothetical protein